MSAPRIAQQIRISPAGDGFAYASIVTGGWSITGIAVRAPEDSPCWVQWPQRQTERGERFPVVTPPPELRDQLEREIVGAYRNALARRGRR